MQINVSLVANTGTFVTDIDRATKQAERAIKKMEAESRAALKDFGKIIAGAATAATVAFAAMVKASINNADQLGKLSQKVGIAVEDLSKLAYAAGLSDVELDSLKQSLIKLGDAAIQAQTGTGDASEAFKALGISVKDAEGNIKSNHDLLLEVSDAFSRYEDGAAKSAIAIDLFGRAGADMIPLLNGGSQAIKETGDELERFGGLVTQEVSNAANEFNDNLTKIKTAGEALALQVAAELLPDLIRLSDQFFSLVKDGSAATETISKLKDGFVVLAAIVRTVSNAFEIAAQDMAGVFGAIAAAATGEFKLAAGILREALADSEADVLDIASAWDLVINGTNEAGQAAQRTAGLIDSLLNAPKGALKYDPAAAKKAQADAKKVTDESARAIEQATESLADLDQSLRQQVATFGLSESAALEYRLTIGDLADEVKLAGEAGQRFADSAIEQAQALEALTAAADEAERIKEVAAAYDEATASARAYLAEITKQGQRTLASFDQTPSQRRRAAGSFPIEDRFTSGKDALDRELASGDLLQGEYDQRLTLLQNLLQAELSEYNKYFDLIEAKQKDFTTSWNNVVQEYVDATSNVGEALAETLVGALDEVADSVAHATAELILFGKDPREAIAGLARHIATELLSALIRVGIQALITKTLLASIGGGAGGAGGSAGLTGFSGGAFASGGYVGDDPRNRIAGVVHGQEFVVNADATRKNRDVLEAINDGTYATDAVSVPRSGGGSMKPTINQRIINVPDKSYIKDYLMGDEGDEVFVNWVGRNGARLKQVVAGA